MDGERWNRWSVRKERVVNVVQIVRDCAYTKAHHVTLPYVTIFYLVKDFLKLFVVLL